jgi:hypothetical protein
VTTEEALMTMASDHIDELKQQRDRMIEALFAIASMDDEENEWDAVDKYQAARGIAKGALSGVKR